MSHQISKNAAQHAADNHEGISKHWADGRPRPTCGFDGMPLDHRRCNQCNADKPEGRKISEAQIR